ncbi:MAG: alpha-hydroxy-acid oxidizing protein [Terriglobales bacterium]|jgi:hypothetical protein
MHPGGEVAAARAAGLAGTAYILSTISGHKLEDVRTAPQGPVWYKLHLLVGREAVEGALDLAKLEHPIQAVGGYQLTYLKDANNPLWISYLRKWKMQTFGEHHVGVPDEAPLELRFDLPKDHYRVRIINLTANREECRCLRTRDTLKLSKKTSDDYVLVVTR